nr:adenosylcobinamide-phosphate synthase CbiB [Lachnospiraceae bacterium]
MIFNHLFAFVIGFILDMVFGDPAGKIHPIRFIGWLISSLEKQLYVNNNKDDADNKNLIRGRILVVIVVSIVLVVSLALIGISYYVNRYAGIIIESILSWQILSAKCLKVETMKVYTALDKGSLTDGRRALSMLVSRDTAELDEAGVIRGAVETVAENTCDGVVAPLIYLAAGGPVLGFVYKAINTMDSMVGYKNDRYMFFGRAAAKTDDVFNYIPARIGARIMLLSAAIGAFDVKGAYNIYKRDRNKSESPNAAQTESVCAGALGISLGGDTKYFGKVVHKESIGDDLREV